MIAKLLIEKTSQVFMKPKEVDIGDLFIRRDNFNDIRSAIKKYTTTHYIHQNDALRIIRALEDGLKK